MTPQELIRKITAVGWYLWDHGGRHDKYRHPTRIGTLIIERHTKDIATGTLNKLLKDAGLK